ncbi:50S ribosomal protein L18 [Candidatus Woesearchaeota archaeon]|nr:50S ribosomal protein L18 [Candidatus Woesearchaeota archaeon]
MADKNYTVVYRRKRSGKTNYKKRLKLLFSLKPRLVVRKSLKSTMVQLVEYNADGDKILATACSKDLTKLGWKGNTSNLSSAYLTGLLLGQKAKKAKVTEAILDIGLNTPVKGSRLFASVKGVIDSGLKVPSGNEIFPSKDRIEGRHIVNYALHLQKSDMQKYEKQFSLYLKQGLKPETLVNHFAEIKNKIVQQ